jgi:hypothetical protein
MDIKHNSVATKLISKSCIDSLFFALDYFSNNSDSNFKSSTNLCRKPHTEKTPTFKIDRYRTSHYAILNGSAVFLLKTKLTICSYLACGRCAKLREE